MLGFLGRYLRSSSRASLSSPSPSLHGGCCYSYGGCRSFSSSSSAAQPLLPQPQPLPRHPFLHPTPGLPPLFRAVPHAAADLSDYEIFRRSLCGGLAYKALLVDAAGTLIVPAQPAAQVYAEIGRKYGVQLPESEILRRYRWAYAQPWSRSRLRYENDARPFWQFIVEQATSCKDPAYLEELYNYYTTAEAWRIADPNAGIIFEALTSAGVKVAVVSNFDTRLRPLMNALHCYDWFDAMAISAEVGAEKPNPAIFSTACDLLGVKAEEAVHVGDDRRNDVWGARDAGCDAWLWGENVTSFAEVAEKIGVEVFLGRGSLNVLQENP